MESLSQQIYQELSQKQLLLSEANYLERIAKHKREQVQNSKASLVSKTSLLQNELLLAYDEYLIYESYLQSLIQEYESVYNTSFPLILSSSFYSTYYYQDLSLSSICDTLCTLSKRIVDLLQLLQDVCSTLGHHYQYVKTDSVFDYEGLEVTFAPRDIYYCACCGASQFLDPEISKDQKMDVEDIDRLKKVRSLQKFVPFSLPFQLVDENQNEIDGIKR